VLFLVRHAKAGSRKDWDGDDVLRPLSNSGWRQAQALVAALAADSTMLVSSPYVRCRQTLQPLADRLGLTVVADERLAEGDDARGALALIESATDGTVMCSHGDVIPATMAALERRGCEIVTPPDWRKASVWVLHRADDGEINRAEVWPPPETDR
jgi:8-oxo-dGTP diphosphatase